MQLSIARKVPAALCNLVPSFVSSMRMRVVAMSVLCGSCWAGSAPVSSSSVVVRMAKDGEFPVGETPSPTKGQLRSSRFGCEKKGALTREHFDPVAAFAQEHLLAGDDGDVHVSFAMGSRKPQLEDGVNIVVEPRSSVGELRVVHVGPPFYASGTRWAETGYCLHVVKHGRGTTVVVQKSWATIK